jgi:cytoskeletal protein CcmA (bactofilin family)
VDRATTWIARHARIGGHIEADGPLTIDGRVEGAVRVADLCTVGLAGVVIAEIRAARVEVRGVVIGDIIAEHEIIVVAGARVVGDLRAPEVQIAPGAVIEGRVDRGSPRPKVAEEPTRPTLRARAPLRRPARPGGVVVPVVGVALPALAGPPAPPPPRAPRPASRVRLVPHRRDGA